MGKSGNVFCGVIAGFLSAILVILLMLTPMVTSALSLVNANTITDVVVDIVRGLVQAEADNSTAADYQLNKLTEVSTEAAEDEAAKGIADLLESYLGVPLSAAELEKVMTSNAVKELITAYTDDLAGVLTGKQESSTMDAEKIKTIVSNNIDEVVRIVQEIKPDMSEEDKAELKNKILSTVEEKADEILEVLPKPEKLKEQILENVPQLGSALKALENKNTIELALAGVMAVLCGLIFLCRMHGFRGLRTLAVNMFVGGGFNGLICIGLLGGTAGVANMLSGEDMGAVVGTVIAAFSKALLTRTIIILVVGAALLIAYIVLRKMRAQQTR